MILKCVTIDKVKLNFGKLLEVSPHQHQSSSSSSESSCNAVLLRISYFSCLFPLGFSPLGRTAPLDQSPLGLPSRWLAAIYRSSPALPGSGDREGCLGEWRGNDLESLPSKVSLVSWLPHAGSSREPVLVLWAAGKVLARDEDGAGSDILFKLFLSVGLYGSGRPSLPGGGGWWKWGGALAEAAVEDAETGIFNLGTRVGDALSLGKLILPPLLPGGEGAPRTGSVSLTEIFSLYLGSARFKDAGFVGDVDGIEPPTAKLLILLWVLAEGARGSRRDIRTDIGGLAAAAEGDGDLDLWPKLVEPLLGGGEEVWLGDGLLDLVSSDVDL